MMIYLITNTVNQKRYIGQTIVSLKKRWQRHCWKNKKNQYPLYRAIQKYGKDKFTIEMVAQASSIEELNTLEKKYIDLYKTMYPAGYNLTLGGQDGPKFFLDETIEKLRNAAEKSALKTRRAVESLNLQTGEILRYKSVSEAKRSSLKRVNVDQAIRTGGTANGCLWKYIENPLWPRKKAFIEKCKKPLKFVNQANQEFIPENPVLFCKENGLDYSHCHKIAKGNPRPTKGKNGKSYLTVPQTHKGWKIGYTSMEDFYEKNRKSI